MARRGTLGEIKWEGLKELQEELKRNRQKFEAELPAQMNRFKQTPLRGAIALSPRDERDLEKSWAASSVKIRGDEYSFSIGTSIPYAAWLHERNPPKGTVRHKYTRGAVIRNYYIDGWGLKTRRKPQWRGYTPGRKFLANAVEGSAEEYHEMNTRLLEILTGGSGR